jgi:iron complex transport system permease protein
VLLRNPLADPSILGVSGGASVGALSALLLGLPLWVVQASAFAGACAAAGVLLALAVRLSGWNIHRVLLTGVAIGAGCGAIVSMLLSLAAAGQVQGMLFWLLGDLSGATRPAAPWIALAFVMAAAQPLALRLDALTLGPLKARSLGVAVGATQGVAFLAATVATVAAVLVAGPIGFVGLVVPHALRLAGFSDHGRLLPLTALGGGALVAAADTIARSVAAPLEFPVGAVTALVGVPVLLVLLARTR